MKPSVHSEVISLIHKHQSIRKFKRQAISPEELESIISSAQKASSSSNMQAYSIVGVTDQEQKHRLAELAGNQPYIAECSHFLVFCADLYRLQQVAKKHDVDAVPALEYTEMFMIATIDAALAAQNAALAAESIGLGIVYIGGIRNRPQEVAELLELPQFVYPVFGMCVGYPDQDPGPKPRLPQQSVYFENKYSSYEQVKDQLEEYDQTMSAYLDQRTQGKRKESWSEMMSKSLSQPRRTHMKDFLAKRGFPLK